MLHGRCDLVFPPDFIVSCESGKTLFMKNQRDFKENLKKGTFLFLRAFSTLTLQSEENQIRGADKKVFGLTGRWGYSWPERESFPLWSLTKQAGP